MENRLKPTTLIQQEVFIHSEGSLYWAILVQFLHDILLISWNTI